MRVKRYVVDSMPEALGKIRTELGQDAIILNSKPIKTGGFFGLFGKQQIEVIAAIDEKTSERDDPPIRQQEMRSGPNTFAAKQAYQRSAAPTQPMSAERQKQVVPSAAQPFGSQAAASEQSQPDRTSADAEPVRTGKAAVAENEELVHELRDMRNMFQKWLMNDRGNHLPPPVQAVRERLLQQEVEEETAAEIVKELLLQSEHPEQLSEPEAFQRTAVILDNMLQKAMERPVRIAPSVKYVFFFGPTGVGKTTTIAKLAADSMLKEKRKIGFITADTYRIAAVEQLKTYANILNVPLEVVFSPKEIVQAMERLSSCDLVFIDTAGRNFRNDQYVQGISELVRYGGNSVNYLVLSLTSKYTDLKAIIRNFQDVPITQVIFTKADETEAYGAILNVARSTDLSFSYITTGQNVPDDIVVATPRLVAKMILGDKAYA
ncbi:flagellar biosynthesis protein FlhF [Brevibacillus sp. H7]|uniref:flagellar biosynthesis protein FlhF n=1 Tax=Brevibacillus sp. H7 TaxID=3349138 RepID=UPI0038108479